MLRYCKSLLFVGLVCVLFVTDGGGCLTHPSDTAMAPMPNRFTVVIDPGHGGVDSGCVANGVAEKDVVLPIALKLANLLRAHGIEVIKTRATDIELHAKTSDITWRKRWQLDLQKRVEISEAAQPDVLVSIHANSINSRQWRGAQAFYQRGDEDGKALASSIQESLRSVLKNTDRTVNQGDYYVLRHSTVPATIVEVGFLSNPQEAQALTTAKYQEQVAWAIFQGIVKYLNTL